MKKIELANSELHPRSVELLKNFMDALADKMIKSQIKYGYQDGWADDDWEEECREGLLKHMEKGDPKDVAIYAAFMWHHQWPTKEQIEFVVVDGPTGYFHCNTIGANNETKLVDDISKATVFTNYTEAANIAWLFGDGATVEEKAAIEAELKQIHEA